MSLGSGNIGTNPKKQLGSPFDPGSANNGLSVDPITGKIVLGQTVGAVGNPAQLLSNREIPMNGFSFALKNFFSVDPFATFTYFLGDKAGSKNGANFTINDSNAVGIAFIDNTPHNIHIGINTPNPIKDLDICNLLNPLGGLGICDTFPTNYASNVLVNSNFEIAMGGNNALLITKYGNISAGAAMTSYKTRGGAPSTPAAVVNGDQLGVYNVFGVSTGGPTVVQTHRILYTAGTIGAAFVGGEIFWQTTNSTGALGNRMKLTENGTLGIGTTAPNASVKLQVESTTQGFAGPRMTTAQKNAIAAPLVGLEVFDATLNQPAVFDGAWKSVPIGNDGAAAPATTVGIAIASFYGTAATKFLGDPNGWAALTINGTVYKVPLYT